MVKYVYMIKNPVRGMRDILSSEMAIRDYILNLLEKETALSGFQKIETPAIEHLENLSSKQGGENEKLIFKILKRGESLKQAQTKGEALSDSALRYDLTVPLARYYADNQQNLLSPFKSLQVGSAWRADAPQKGRFRQFTTCDLDIIGDSSILAEIDVVSTGLKVLSQVLTQAGVTGLTLRVNDRRFLLASALSAGFSEADCPSLLIALDKNDKIGFNGVRQELLTLGFSEEKVAKFIALFENPEQNLQDFCQKIADFLPDKQIINELELIIQAIEGYQLDAKVVFDPSLVRGMGYYTGPIFECSANGLSSSIAGGGRYDQMIGKFTGNLETPACGFSLGFDRIVTILLDAGFVPPKQSGKTAILVGKKVPNESYPEIIKKAETLRQAGQSVSVLPMARNLGRQISLLEENGYDKFEKIFE